MRIAIISCSLLLATFAANSQNPIWFTGESDVLTINPYVEVYSTSDTLSLYEAFVKMEAGELRRIGAKTSPGFSTDIFWIHFKVANPTKRAIVLDLDNPHIDYVYLYQIYPTIGLIGTGGDRMSFDERTNPNRRFIFHLSRSDTSEYLLQLDKRFASISFPLRLWTSESFYALESRDQIFFGVYFGILAFISIASLLAGIGLKHKVFIFYAFYVFMIAGYLFTNLGLAFQYFYPDSSVLNSYIRVFIAVFSSIFGTLFFKRFLNVQFYFPGLNRFFNGTIYFMIFMLSAWLVMRATYIHYYELTIALLNIFYGLQFLTVLLIFWILAQTFSEQPKTVLVFIFAFGAVLSGAVLFICVEYGIISEINFPISPIMIGSIVEVFIFSVSMIIKIKQINDTRNELAQKIAEQQKELIRAFVKGGERERNRISSELHDHIGSQLALIKLKLQKGNLDKENLSEEISRVCDDVRDLSHQLIPHEMQVAGFINTLKGHCRQFSQTTGIKVNLDEYSFPKLEEDLSMHLFRIVEEALHNVKKHANAKEIDIQLFGYPDEIVLTIEDDGVGFDTRNVVYGFGLNSIKGRVEAFGGTFDLSTALSRGTNMIIHIPYPQKK